MRSIGMDVHRSFAQIAVVEDGLCRDEGRIGVKPEDLRAWAETLDRGDQIALEATTNSDAIATMLRPLVARVVVSNPRKTRAIAEAKVKTDKVDALLYILWHEGTHVVDGALRLTPEPPTEKKAVVVVPAGSFPDGV